MFTGDEITREWVECFDDAVKRGEDVADSIFFRMALMCLPAGVDPDDPRVVERVGKIREAVRKRGAK